MDLPELDSSCRDAWTAEGLADKTIAAYLAVLHRASVRLEAMGTTVLAATPREVRALADGWPKTRSSRVQLRTALARAWAVAEESSERPPGSPLAVPVPSKPRYRCRALSEPQAARLAAAARADAGTAGPAGLAVLVALYAGLRREEIARLEHAHVRGDWLTVVGKGSVAAELPIHPELGRRLAAWPRGASPYVFPGRQGGHVTPATVWTWTRRLSRVALGADVAPHVLRHTAIATLNDATRDLRAAQEFARHASPETTVLYTRVGR
ncbi:MAG: site-specific integrase, partial [Actinomycetota bacterium]|nr:site-specific integrase [Actinomycetota bacterium]